jgi:RHS repeat-associated protein
MTLVRYIQTALLFAGILACADTFAQSPGFVQTDVIKVSGVTTDAGVNSLGLGNIQTSRTFIDGLGRPIQSVAMQANPVNNRDIVQPAVYNTLGQQTIGYLPYADDNRQNANGSFRTNAVNDQLSFYQNSGTVANPNKVANESAYPFSQQVFENSPLQRVLSAGTTGTGFQTVSGGHYKTAEYRLNNSTQDGAILMWKYDGTKNSSNYTDNSLTVTDGMDEDGAETLVFADAAGRTILKRQMLSGTKIDTYYVYGLGGSIAYIIPPQAVSLMNGSGNYSLTQANISTLIFKFVYDGLGRLIEKTVPAKGILYIVYDPLNRPVLMQDANMLANNQWNYIRYDVKGRAVSQGIYTDVTRLGRSAMQTYVNGLASAYNTAWYETRNSTQSTGYYSATVFPTAGTGTLTPLSYAYFDDYKLNPSGTAYAYVAQGLSGEATPTTAAVKDMPTMVRKATVGTGFSGWLLSVSFYDKRLNPIQTQSNNQLNYTLDVLTDYKTIIPDFTGVPQVSHTKQVTKNGATTNTITVQTNFSYDYMYRIKAIDQGYNGAALQRVAAYTYNEMGQVVKKSLGQVSGSTYLQNVDMRYNIRGMLTSINNSKLASDAGTAGYTNDDSNDVFGMTFLYDQADANIGNTAYYSGRLSAVKWMSKDGSGTSSWERSYRYTYDQLHRYTGSFYAERATASTGLFNNNVGGFDEYGITYTAGGNILALKRNSSTQGTNSHIEIDNLTYAYNNTNNPNQLLTLAEGTSDANHNGNGFTIYSTGSASGNYVYDANGNLKTDPYKGVSIGYNYLNRTDNVTVSASQYTKYTYDSDGGLIRKVAGLSGSTTTTDYIGGFVYINNVLSYFPMPEGRVLSNGSTLTQEFVITDQQGNARVSFQNNAGVAKVTQENSYYGFGMTFLTSPVSLPTTPNKQLYNGGSEWQNDFGNNTLPNYYQTFYRNYDPAIGRFVGVDPVAESAESMTSYQYAGNNPIMMNDPMGDLVAEAGMNQTGIPQQHTGNPVDDFNKWMQVTQDAMAITTQLQNLGNSDASLFNTVYNQVAGVYGLHGASTMNSGIPSGQFSVSYTTTVFIGDPNSTSGIGYRMSSHTVTIDTNQGRQIGLGNNGSDVGLSPASVNPLDGISQISNMGTVLFGVSGIGIQALRQFAGGQGPKFLARALGFGTQRTADALRGTLGYINTIGKYTGYAGQALNTFIYFSKLTDPKAKLTRGDHVGFWTGSAVWASSLIWAANPIVLGAVVLYGAAELGSWAYNGKSIEQNIFDK